jgi:hypothetical protein
MATHQRSASVVVEAICLFMLLVSHEVDKLHNILVEEYLHAAFILVDEYMHTAFLKFLTVASAAPPPPSPTSESQRHSPYA